MEKIIRLDTIKKADPFKVPEGYFESFVTDMMSKLPERLVEKPKVINLWERIKPWVYMAAVFVGVALMVNFFEKKHSNPQDVVSVYASEGLKLHSSNDIEDYYRYYEDELTKIVYDDAVAGFQDDTAIKDDNLSEK